MSLNDSITLSKWILANASGEITPLKLQKLMFYCYGISMAHGYDKEISPMDFEAWKFGPVNPNVYHNYKSYGSKAISTNYFDKIFMKDSFYSPNLNKLLKNILKVYGSLSPMDLVRQSHLETPWINAWSKGGGIIDNSELKDFFISKYILGKITLPELILDSGILEIDKIPLIEFTSFEDMANSI